MPEAAEQPALFLPEAAPAAIPAPPPVTDSRRESVATARAAQRDSVAGEWLLMASPHPAEAGVYAPEYIELRISEAGGALRGRYTARYRIPDRAISPTVSFAFEAVAGEAPEHLPWTGAGGSQGEVSLHLLTPETLQVTWVAHRMGSELGLISGSATLIRKLD